MADGSDKSIELPRAGAGIAGRLWPSPAYDRQVARLKEAVGRRIYLIEIRLSETNIAVTWPGRSFGLLDVLDFPQPDPGLGLYPHLVLLDDGRGINLGRIARITDNRAFDPKPGDILYEERYLLAELLYHERRLSEKSIRETSTRQLAGILGKRVGKVLK